MKQINKFKNRWVPWFILFGFFNLSFLGSSSFGARILVEEKGKSVSRRTPSSEDEVGRGAAEKYFTKEKGSDSPVNARLLSLHIGGFLRSKSYQWGSSSTAENVGLQNAGVTYKLGEWTQSMDLSLRLDYLRYSVDRSKPIKISFLSLLTFPDSGANFPLYFGLGAGPGIFLSQISKESNISLDYQLIFGMRWPDVWHNSGFFIESGIKDHIHILSDGQFTSQFLSAGAVFRL